MPTQSMPASLPSGENSAGLGALTWPFGHRGEAEAATIGRDPTPAFAPSKQHAPTVVLPHAYASRAHLSVCVRPVSFGYNKSAETSAASLRQVGKNPTFVDGVALRKGEEKSITSLFNSSAGAEGFASLEELRRAEMATVTHEQVRELNQSAWAGGCADAALVTCVRLKVACRITFPAEFAKILPVVLVVAEVVMPRRLAPSPGAAPSGLPMTLAVGTIGGRASTDSDVTRSDGASPARAAVPRLGTSSGSFVAKVAARAGAGMPTVPSDDDDDDAADPPPARRAPRSEMQQQSSVAGFQLLPSSDDDDDAAAVIQQRRASAQHAQLRAAQPVAEAAVPAPAKVASWAEAASAGTGGASALPAPVARRKTTRVSGESRNPGDTKSPVKRATMPPRLASDDDAPIVVDARDGAAAARVASPPAAAAAAPTMQKASSVIRVLSSTDNILLPPSGRAAPTAAAASPPAFVWQWKSKRSAPDSDPAAWTNYGSDDCGVLNAAVGKGEKSVRLGAFVVELTGAELTQGMQRSASGGAGGRAVRRVARGDSKVVSAHKPAADGPTGGAKWMWNSNTSLPEQHPHAWKPYAPADAAKLEAAYMKGGSNVKLNDNYSVAFNDRTAGLVQYRNDDKSRWRSVRRVGGPERPRGVGPKQARVVICSDDDSSDGWASTGSDDSYSGVVSDSGSSGDWGDSDSD
jgi:hypothetical protein